MSLAAVEQQADHLRALPGDDVRQILWRFADRFDLQMLVQSVRAVARGPVARLVAAGARNTHEWTPEKNALLQAFDESGITGVFMEPSQGGFIEGPKNLALALVAFELAWVDAGAATGSLAGCLALSPIHERGTPGAARLLHEPLRAAPAGRGPQAVARRLLPHRAHPLRGRRNRHARRQGAGGRMEGGRGAHAAGGKARPLHHQHGVRQLRHRRGGIRTTRASRAPAW